MEIHDTYVITYCRIKHNFYKNTPRPEYLQNMNVQ